MKQAKPCIFNGVEYASMREAGEALGVSTAMISKYVKQGVTTIIPREKKTCKKTSVIVDGVEYKSMRDAEIKIFGKYTGRLQARVARTGEKTLDSIPELNRPTSIACTDTLGNTYKSQAEMERALGLSQGTISKRIHNKTLNTSHKQRSDPYTSGKQRCRYYYQGIIYESLRWAMKWLHHGRPWILQHCIELPEYIHEWTPQDEARAWVISVKELLYKPKQWNEDSIIAEVDRRMKKLFAHGKLIKE